MAVTDYTVTLTGLRPLLLHADNLEWADVMTKWKDDPANRKNSTPGDDRSPAFRWLGCLYHDGARVVMPSENIQSAMMGGGAMVPVPGGGGKKTFKAQSQSGMMPVEDAWPLKVRGREISWVDLQQLCDEPRFGLHAAKAREMGFSLFTKRAKVGNSKHVRVRPKFDEWSATGTVRVFDEQISHAVLEQILTYAGKYKGLGDWRPGSKTPGSFGMFEAKVKRA